MCFTTQRQTPTTTPHTTQHRRHVEEVRTHMYNLSLSVSIVERDNVRCMNCILYINSSLCFNCAQISTYAIELYCSSVVVSLLDLWRSLIVCPSSHDKWWRGKWGLCIVKQITRFIMLDHSVIHIKSVIEEIYYLSIGSIEVYAIDVHNDLSFEDHVPASWTSAAATAAFAATKPPPPRPHPRPRCRRLPSSLWPAAVRRPTAIGCPHRKHAKPPAPAAQHRRHRPPIIMAQRWAPL